ncbi:Na/Pi cotransporter family protein [Siculibacillus lacustris]|uniref:Na/Pi cotransporter family protein n=1 Tax=Siculibacillus lacustris TaxID=1549641 RepID=A0A4Q9VYI8_9HYPH|nr:Na/Pi cotransporter family protein [Siculibacillus lacustris]TBW41211.1 Na/Pi cotransporter family protein [Siculibacillus lacustris]
MATTSLLVDLAGTVALLLWGIHMVQTGIQRAFGSSLRRVMAAWVGGRLPAFATGLGITAALQSSTATGLMVASLAADGLIATVPALAVMLGANVGSTLIVQLLAFDVRHLAPFAILVGVVMFRTGGITRTRDLGRVAIGLGLLMLSLSRLVAILTPHDDVAGLRVLIDVVVGDPIVGVLVAAIGAWLAHSSAAVVLLVMSFAVQGVVPLDAAIALVVGANLGTALNPVIEGRGEPAGRRVAVGNLAVRILAAIAAIAGAPIVIAAMRRFDGDPARAVADFHTAFNLAAALVALPLLTPAARLLHRLLPDHAEAADRSRPLYLDPAATTVPALAIGHAAREALRMVDLLEEMVAAMRRALDDGDRVRLAAAIRLDDALDRLNGAIKTYLSRLDPDGLSAPEEARLAAVLAFVINLEHAGDIVHRDVAAGVGKYVERGFSFSHEGEAEMQAVFDRVLANLRAAASIFVTENVAAARLLAGEKQVFRNLETRLQAIHFSRLRETPDGARDAGALHLDLVRDLKRLNDHLVAGAAYPVLERGGDLMATRLRQDGGARR